MATGFTFVPETHAYVLESGLRAPSTTQVLRRAGLVRFDQVAADVLENKRNLGAAVHACTQYLDEGDLDESTVTELWVPYVEAWKRFKQECAVSILGIEQRSIGTINGMPFGMTFDRLAIVNGREAVIDLKCSSSRSEWWGLQLASYDLGLGQCKDQLRRARYAVQLGSDGKYRLWPFEDPGDYDAFTWALALTWWMLNHKYKLEGEEE